MKTEKYTHLGVLFDKVNISGYTILVPIVGFLHISTIKIKKITGNWFYITITLIALITIILALFVL